MVRRARKTLLVLACAVLLVVAAVLVWLLGSRSGAAWLLARVDAGTELQISAELEGTLWSGLDLTELKLAWPSGDIGIDRLHLAWRPLHLLTGELAFTRIEAGVVQVNVPSNAPTPATATPGFALPQLPSAYRVAIDGLTVGRLVIAADSGEPLVIDDIRGGVQLRQGRLQLDDLHLRLAAGRLEGSVLLDPARPQLAADLRWSGAVFAADWDTLRLQTRLDRAGRGPLNLHLQAGSAPRIHLQANATLTATALQMQQVQVRRAEGPDTIDGSLQLDWSKVPRLKGDLQLARVNLAPESGWPTDLSGRLQAELTAAGYAGEFDLTSRRPGLEAGRLAATVRGDFGGLELTGIDADWLDGSLGGTLRLDWQDGLLLVAQLQGDGLDPAALRTDLEGRLQLRVAGELVLPAGGQPTARWDLHLDPSTLRQHPVEGQFTGSWRQEDLQIEALTLQGGGLQLQGSGSLRHRLDWQVQLDDLALLAADLQGRLAGRGWLARSGSAGWRGGGTLEAKDLHVYSLQAAAASLDCNYAGADGESRVELNLQQLQLPAGEIAAATLSGRGRPGDHRLELQLREPDWRLAGTAAGAWVPDGWRGQLERLEVASQSFGNWSLAAAAPLSVTSQKFDLAGFRFEEERGGAVGASAALDYRALLGAAALDWQRLPLDPLTPWLAGLALEGESSGEVRLELLPRQALRLTASAEAAPRLRFGRHELRLSRSQVAIDWDERGLRADAELQLQRGGQLQLAASSPQPGRRQWPEQIAYEARCAALELQQFTDWLPAGIAMNGNLQATAKGSWAPGAAPRHALTAHIEQGELAWQGEDGIVRAALRRAELQGQWQRGWSEGEVQLQLAEHGTASGRFRLPLPADDPEAALAGDLEFSLDEFGLLLMLMPGVSNERLGRIEGTLQLGGTVRQPRLTGRFALHGAGADVAALGLQLRDAELAARFDDSTLQIERWQVLSGEGYLEGEGRLRLSAWQLRDWSLDVRGKNATVLNLPEIRAVADPDLHLTGTAQRLALHGEVTIPSLLISEEPRTGQVEPSEDVVRRDEGAVAAAKSALPLELGVKIRLGEHVVVKARGLDARLEGELRVENGTGTGYTGRGAIAVKQGHYAAYGIKLPISRGRATFSGGAVQDPTLDVLAERTIGEVRAGVQVTGTPRRPLVKLVSTPALPDTDILSYIVLGHPLGAEAGKGDNLMLAANALLSRSESAALQEKVRNRLGIDVFEVQAGGEGGVTGSMVSVGKYLTPDLYLSFGQSLFTPENVAKLRYRMGRHWEAESQFGTVSGADLSYRIEFR